MPLTPSHGRECDTTMSNDNTIPVVVLPEAKEEAYHMGFERFGETDDEPEPEFFSHYTESAEWANSKAPQLRCMAGARDPMGKGTYTEHREIVIVEEPDDRPMTGETTDSRFIFEELVTMFRRGAYDAMNGNGRDVTRHL